jgi:hypothetical protein
MGYVPCDCSSADRVERWQSVFHSTADYAVQKLYCGALTLHGISERVSNPDHAQELRAVLDGLQHAVLEIQSTVLRVDNSQIELRSAAKR